MKERQQVQTRPYMLSKSFEGTFAFPYRFKKSKAAQYAWAFQVSHHRGNSHPARKVAPSFPPLLPRRLGHLRYSPHWTRTKLTLTLRNVRYARAAFVKHFATPGRDICPLPHGRSILHVVGRTVSSALIVPLVFQPHPVCSSSNFTPAAFGPKLNMYMFWKS